LRAHLVVVRRLLGGHGDGGFQRLAEGCNVFAQLANKMQESNDLIDQISSSAKILVVAYVDLVHRVSEASGPPAGRSAFLGEDFLRARNQRVKIGTLNPEFSGAGQTNRGKRLRA
jgi:hypothetical protein